jgi:hypothetical protein
LRLAETDPVVISEVFADFIEVASRGKEESVRQFVLQRGATACTHLRLG